MVVIIILTVNSISDYKVLGGDERGGSDVYHLKNNLHCIYAYTHT